MNPTPKYAKDTEVTSERSADELQRMLVKYGATRFMLDRTAHATTVVFEMKGRYVRLVMKTLDLEKVRTNAAGNKMHPKQAAQTLEKETRRRWRVLVMVVRAKLEAVEAGFSTFEHEFLADTLMYDGTTVGEVFLPKLAEAQAAGRMPVLPLMLGPGQ